MPIFDNTYKSWDGTTTPLIYRLLSFTRFTYLQVKGMRKVNTVFVFSWLPFLLYAMYIYVVQNPLLLKKMGFPSSYSLFSINSDFFIRFIMTQLPFLFLFTIFVGPRLISPDLSHKALPMILSKPINRWEYIFGKFMVLFLLLSLLSWFQGSVLFFLQTAAASPTSEWRQHFWNDYFWILPKMILFSFVIIVSLDLVALFFSSITHNFQAASTGLIMFIIGSSIIANIVRGIFMSEKWLVLSPIVSAANIGKRIFGDASVGNGAWLYFICLWVICLMVLHSRVRAFQLYRE